MSLDSLPTEIITKILSYLTSDTKGYIGLSSACKKFNQASHDLVYSDIWVRDRPFTYELNPTLFSNRFDEGYLRDDGDFVSDRIYSLLNAKYRNISTLKLRNLSFSDCAVIEAFKRSSRLNKELTERGIRALVELELRDCHLSLKWINGILIELTNLSYLTLKNVRFDKSTTLFYPKDRDQRVASKYLKRLRLIQLDIGFDICRFKGSRFNDTIFGYFLNNFPSIEFDVSGSCVWVSRNEPTFRVNMWWTFSKIFLYLKRHRAVLRHFVWRCGALNSEILKEILLEDELKHLKITAEYDFMGRQARDGFRSEVGAENFSRLILPPLRH